jgi:hypothetical protein
MTPAESIARGAAHRLAANGESAIRLEVERALSAAGGRKPDQYVDVAAIGSLVVSVAALAWTVYTDLRARSGKVTREELRNTVRLRLHDSQAAADPDSAMVIEVVVDETLQYGDREG